MPCDHVGAPELIEMAESYLKQHDVPPSRWDGAHFRWGENLTGGMWSSVVLEIERRPEGWILTRLDRNRDPIPAVECGLKVLYLEAVP